jgi:hypothetical protein
VNPGVAVAAGGPWKFHRCEIHPRCYLVTCGHSAAHFRPDEYDAFVESLPIPAETGRVTP